MNNMAELSSCNDGHVSGLGKSYSTPCTELWWSNVDGDIRKSAMNLTDISC